MRIFIASADSMFRLSLQLLLEDEPGMAVIGIADRSDGLLTQVGASQPEVLLLDWELTKPAPINLLRELEQLEQPPKIIALSIDSQVKEIALASGASDFISKNVPPDDLLPILRRTRQSESSG